MNYVVVGFILVTAVLYGIVYYHNPSAFKRGLNISYKTFTDPSLGLIPLIISAILLAGMVQAVVPREAIALLLGRQAGLRGIAVASVIGAVMPGGPYVAFPIAGGLLKSGASVGAIIALISSWSLMALTRIPLEIPFIGSKLVIVRIASSLIFPMVIGSLGQLVYNQIF